MKGPINVRTLFDGLISTGAFRFFHIFVLLVPSFYSNFENSFPFVTRLCRFCPFSPRDDLIVVSSPPVVTVATATAHQQSQVQIGLSSVELDWQESHKMPLAVRRARDVALA